jgi:hypothetical protein
MLDDEFVTITKKEYEELKDADEMLTALYAAGVDNWEGYDYALENYEENSKSKDD